MNDACYCPTTDKIYGTSGPYVVQFNGTTGLREGFVRVGAPLYGDIRICYHAANDTLYVACLFEPNKQFFGGFAPTSAFPHRDIFPVTTGLVVGARIGMWNLVDTHSPYGGFQWIGSSGNSIYTVYSGPATSGTAGYFVYRVDPTNMADNGGSNSTRFRAEQCGLSPTQIAVPGPVSLANNQQIQFAPIGYILAAQWAGMYVVPHNPVAVEYCPATLKFYVVCGTDQLLRLDTLTPFPGTYTALNLGAVEASADPCRIRYRAADQKLYIPCMTANTVIVWDPFSETGIAKTGFENPVDCVFSASKAWAVQNAVIGLREIV